MTQKNTYFGIPLSLSEVAPLKMTLLRSPNLLFCCLTLLSWVQTCQSKGYLKPLFFRKQIIDHLAEETIPSTMNDYDDDVEYNNEHDDDDISSYHYWIQRYYVDDKYFRRGGTIFLIMGGEQALEPENGIIYPFVSEHLAQQFSGLVLQAEHRFYGASQPFQDTMYVTNQELSHFMTPEQAMWDAVTLVTYIRSKYNCAPSTHYSSKHYCPVVTVGGSYPGFLSAMMRFLHPNIVDAAYAASAPMRFYAQNVSQSDYYNHVTTVAEKSSPGCADSVKSALLNIIDVIAKNVLTLEEAASKLGLCYLPSYMNDRNTFVNEIMMVVGYTFANYNMGYYPPGNTTQLYNACQIFQNETISFFQKVNQFFQPYWGTKTTSHFLRQDFNRHKHKPHCFDIMSQLPSGPNATISSGDWSGVGTKWSGNMWDFQTCSLLVEKIGFSKQSMFPPRTWTLEWLNDHCWRRFQVTPRPDYLVNQWRFDVDSLVENGASRILFTNGLNDGWSVSGIQTNLSSDVVALNFENGAHHSDLSAEGPSENDTEDIQQGFLDIHDILRGFIDTVITSDDLEESIISVS